MADSTRRILCYGGSFNPIHHGHLLCAQAVAENAGFDRVLLIPSGKPPHRARQNDMASAKDRLTMCQLAAKDSVLFDVSDIELRLEGPSFTLETARALKREGMTQVNWLIGGDTVPRLPTWHDYPNLLREVHFVIMARPGTEIGWESLDAPMQSLRQNVVSAPLIDISASQIRERSRTGRSVRFHVPDAVATYIVTHHLYAATSPAPLPK